MLRPSPPIRADSALHCLDIARMPLLSSTRTRRLCCSTLTLRPRMTRLLQSSDRSYKEYDQSSAPTLEDNNYNSRCRNSFRCQSAGSSHNYNDPAFRNLNETSFSI